MIHYRCPGCGAVCTSDKRKKHTCVGESCTNVEMVEHTDESLSQYYQTNIQNEQMRIALEDLIHEHSIDCHLCQRAQDESVPECRVVAYRNQIQR